MGTLRAWLVAVCLCALGSSAQASEPQPVTYRVTLDVDWSAQTHPLDFPDRAHLTAIIGAVHHRRYSLFRDGDTASSGLESVAERGRTRLLRAELEEAADRGRVGSVIKGPHLDAVPGEIVLTVDVTQRHYLVSFVTMLAPSPDWFTGVSVDLRDSDGWVDRLEVPLLVWDAGTAGGETFHERTDDTQPRQSVRISSHPAFVFADGIKPIGRAIFERQ